MGKSKKAIFNCSTECVSYALLGALAIRLAMPPRREKKVYIAIIIVALSEWFSLCPPAVTYLCVARAIVFNSNPRTRIISLCYILPECMRSSICASLSSPEAKKKIHFKIYGIHLSTHFEIIYILRRTNAHTQRHVQIHCKISKGKRYKKHLKYECWDKLRK